jgi:hypothetical protein
MAMVHNSAMPADGAGLAHHPAVAFALIMVSAAGFMTTLLNLRNARLWLLRIGGRRASGVVNKIEFVTGANGEVLRRPIVAFSTQDGAAVVSAPVLYRESVRLDKGSAVDLSYARGRPTRIVVHGYDFRLREPIYATAGLVTAVIIGVGYFKL